MSQKPHDIFGVSLCRNHHAEQHLLGVDAFDRKYGTDLRALAAEFARRSPDGDMRAALKLVQAQSLVDTTPADTTPDLHSDTRRATN